MSCPYGPIGRYGGDSVPPRVFSVRVANKGVNLDAGRKSGKCRT